MTQTYRRFLDVGMGLSSTENLHGIVDEKLMGFGTAVDEKILNLNQMIELLARQQEQSAGLDLRWEVKPLSHYTSADENTAFFADELFINATINGEAIKMYLRFSVVLTYVHDQWKVIHWHGSKPENVQSEEDTFGIETWKQKAEALEKLVVERTADLVQKNRELEIETSLERVRSVAMSMHKPDDLLSVSKSLFAELKSLGFYETRNALINTFNDEEAFFLDYDYSDLLGGHITIIPYSTHPLIEKHLNQIRKATDAFAETIVTDKELESWIEGRRANGEPEDPQLQNISALYYYFYSTGPAAIGLSTYSALSNEKRELLKRFRNVFELAYQRYTDIQKAEAQTREAQIEAALEKIRSRSLAMHQSDELSDVIAVMFKKLNELNVLLGTVAIQLFDKKTQNSFFWVGNNLHDAPPMVSLPYDEAMLKEDTYLRDSWQAFGTGENIINKKYSLEQKNKYFAYVFANNSLTLIPQQVRDYILQSPSNTCCLLVEKNSAVFADNYDGREYSDEMLKVLKRAGKVFEQAYIRFLDLQKAEAQTRAAQIELAVERVRAKALAMHNSAQILEVVATLRNEMLGLEIPGVVAATIYLREEEGYIRMWDLSSVTEVEDGFRVAIDVKFKLEETDPGLYIRRVWNKAETYFVEKQEEKDMAITIEWLRQYYPEQAEDVQQFVDTTPWKYLLHPTVQLAQGKMSVDILDTPPPADMESILLKMGAAFDLAYKRFTDLQNSEAQMKEAQIELALERVRAKTMAMHHSGELSETSSVLFQQIKELGFETWSCGFCIWTDHDLAELWMGADSGQLLPPMMIPYKEEPTHHDIFNAFLQKKPTHHKIWEGKELETHYQFLQTIPSVKAALEQLQKAGLSLPARQCYYAGFFKQGYLLLITTAPNKALEDLSKHFASVFDLTYTRFLDLKKAEAQTKEAQVETALERVRSRSLAMHSSQELKDVVAILFQQLKMLQVDFDGGALIYLFSQGSKDAVILVASPELRLPIEVKLPYDKEAFLNNPIIRDVWIAKETGKNIFNKRYSLEEKNKYFQYIFENNDLQTIPQSARDIVVDADSYTASSIAEKNSLLGVNSWSQQALPEKDFNILTRFSKAFEQAYIRFLDLQKAESNVREANIEASLERVRSRSLAMHQSTELKDVVAILFQQFKTLGVDFDGGAAIHLFSEESKDARILVASPELTLPIEVNLPYDDEAFLNNPIIQDVWAAKETGQNIYNKQYSLHEKDRYFQYVFKHNDLQTIPPSSRNMIVLATSYTASFVAEKNSLLGVNSWSHQLLSEKEFDVLIRFARVFDQAYVRFLDLQKAEAQAREAQIETALEKVRSRTMAMRHSLELSETATVLFGQLKQLGAELWTCGFALCDTENVMVEKWMGSPITGHAFRQFVMPYTADHGEQSMYDTWKNGIDLYTYIQEGEELKRIYEELMKIPSFKENYKELLESGISFPVWQKFYIASYKYGYLLIITTRLFKEEHIFPRFAKVFEQTYTRFLDLQKAEAQTKEAQIETALEKVRSRSIGMQKSEELKDIIMVVYEQLVQLNIHVEHAGFIMDYKEHDDMHIWLADKHAVPSQITIPYFDSPHWNSFIEAKEKGLDFFTNQLSFDQKNTFYKDLFALFPVPEEAKDYYFNCPGLAISTVLLENVGLYIENFSGITYNDEENATLIRFGKVFQQTYTRFLDLQKAEAQTREAQIETALERIRSRTMAMQHSDELAEASFVLDSQIRSLGIKTRGCAFNIYSDNESIEWFSSEMGIMPAYKTPRENLFLRYYKAGQAGAIMHIETFEGDACAAHYNYLCTLPVMGDALKEMIANGGSFPVRQTDHVVYFKYGYLLFITFDPVPEAHDIFIRFTKVFEQTYTRFLDLQKAEAQAIRSEQDLIAIKEAKQKAEEALTVLQATQKQLIQSEKMASLGELTAGIAHEIQNPLNFVNNFSEVSNELLDEMMEEVAKGNYEEVKAIADDVKQNLEKINHHGRRADGIVKGMLQHSRSSNGQKEPTDINALADEYLRLAYHGLRAKDKSFNATLQTDFDETIGNINIVPQDIGRVILNLITNAFYAVSEKKRKIGEGYDPTVSVSTKRIGDRIEVHVQDNGNGIPQTIIDKIFQPFFTTKPTGQGTGLGLSLAYDIVKAHGGNIRVESANKACTTFIIELPAV